jgi:uncharacterized membrane protein YjdF
MANGSLRALVVIVGAALIISGIAPYDRTTWWLEVFPVLIAGPVLVLTARRFPLTPLTYTPLAGGHAADAFLGTQGDVWDTQWDMFCALLGAITAQVILARGHDRSLAKLLQQQPRVVA